MRWLERKKHKPKLLILDQGENKDWPRCVEQQGRQPTWGGSRVALHSSWWIFKPKGWKTIRLCMNIIENQGPFLWESVRFSPFLVEQVVTLKNIRDELLRHGVCALSYIEFSNMQRIIAGACGLCYCKVGTRIFFASHLVMIRVFKLSSSLGSISANLFY